MSRYRGPRLNILKRLGPLPGFGLKFNQKLRQKKRNNQNISLKRRKKKRKSPYMIRLKEKQKLKYNYGLTEKNLMRYIKTARKKKTLTGEDFLINLEMRLDNIIFRFGLAPTLPAARQLVTHGHVLLNGKKRDKPSSPCKINDLVSIKNNKNKNFKKNLSLPSFLKFNSETFVGKINKNASRKDIRLNINELLVLEYYSRSL